MNYERTSEILSDLLAAKERGAQADLARSVHVRAQTVTKWMTGEVPVPKHRWLEIERSLDVERLTFARRTGLLDALPELAAMDDAALEEAWSQTFATPKRDQRVMRPAAGAPADAVLAAIQELGVEIGQLRDEVRELRSEVRPPAPASPPPKRARRQAAR